MTLSKNSIIRYGVLASIIAVVVLVALAWIAGNQLSKPVREAAGDPPPDLQMQAVEIVSESGGTIRGWLHGPDNPRGAVLLLHGVRATRHSMVGRARFLAIAGYAVLLVDLQAHGESDGHRITFGHLESYDVRASIEFLRAAWPEAPLAVIGSSLGGAAALLATQPLGIDALVLEAVYPNVRQAIDNRLCLRFGAVGPLFTPLLSVQFSLRLGINADQLRPIDKIHLISAPVLVIAGQEDRRTTLPESLALFEAAREPKELWVVPGVRHVDFHRFDRSNYENRVLRFLEVHFNR